MEIILISYHITEKFDFLKAFVILDEEYFYYISTVNNIMGVCRRCSAFNNNYSQNMNEQGLLDILLKLAYSEKNRNAIIY